MEEGSPRQRQVAARAGVTEGLASFLEVRGNSKMRPCGVSEMVAEGEGLGNCWFFLPKSQRRDGKISCRRGHPQIACEEKVGRELGQSELDPCGWGGGGEPETWKIPGTPPPLCCTI